MTNLLAGKRALILGEDTRSFLSVIRSLGRASMSVDVVAFSNLSPALASNFIDNIYQLNYVAYTSDDWTARVTALLKAQHYDLIIPCDERAIYPLIEIRQKLALTSNVVLPENHQIAPLFDKYETRKLATRLGIAVAKGEEYDLTTIDMDKLINEYGFPVVLKPTKSYDSDKLNQRNSVVIAHNKQQIIEFSEHNPNCLVESYFSGFGMGVSILSYQGQLRGAFAHKRVSEPEHGGGSSYRRATDIQADMLDACQRICIELNYTGVAMFEFKFNPQTNRWILIEIKARFWGSLPLAIAAGVDFPKLLAYYQLTEHRPAKLTYNKYTFARSLSADVYDMKASFDSVRSKKGLAEALFKTLPRLASFSRLLTTRDSIDSFAWDDRAPFWSELKGLLPQKVMMKIAGQHQLKKQRKLAIEQIKQNNFEQITIVCYGNIMRSPFAALLLKQKLNQTALHHISVDSAGFHQQQGRQSPQRCINAASTWQVDLSAHTSTWLQQSHIDSKQLIVYFDSKHEYLLANYYHSYQAINLAVLIPPPAGPLAEIRDPYDYDDDFLNSCYQHINDGLSVLVSALTESP